MFSYKSHQGYMPEKSEFPLKKMRVSTLSYLEKLYFYFIFYKLTILLIPLYPLTNRNKIKI